MAIKTSDKLKTAKDQKEKANIKAADIKLKLKIGKYKLESGKFIFYA